MMFPATLRHICRKGKLAWENCKLDSPGSALYMILYVVLIIFFTYFWTATQFRPDQIASDMKKNGAFIPGIRQGKPTQDYLESTMNRITLIGSSIFSPDCYSANDCWSRFREFHKRLVTFLGEQHF